MVNAKELLDLAQQYFGKAEKLEDGSFEFKKPGKDRSVIVKVDGELIRFYSKSDGFAPSYETCIDLEEDPTSLYRDMMIGKIKYIWGERMAENTSVADKLLSERFFESEEYNKMYSNVATYDNEDHTSWEEAKKVINRDLTGKPKHDIFKNEVDMSGKKVCSTNPPKSTTPQNNQAGSPYHESKDTIILKTDEIKKLEEDVEADKKLLMKKMKENMEASDLFIVVPNTPYSYDFSDFEDFTVRVGDVTGYTMRADDVNSILTVGEVDPDDVKVYECPDYIAESEDPCPEIQDVDSLQQIYDVYSFFDL